MAEARATAAGPFGADAGISGASHALDGGASQTQLSEAGGASAGAGAGGGGGGGGFTGYSSLSAALESGDRLRRVGSIGPSDALLTTQNAKTAIVQEGGYNVELLGTLLARFLTGWAGA